MALGRIKYIFFQMSVTLSTALEVTFTVNGPKTKQLIILIGREPMDKQHPLALGQPQTIPCKQAKVLVTLIFNFNFDLQNYS